MIKNIVFDIGNVLTDFCWEKFLLDQGFDDEIVARIANASVLCELWGEFDRGTMSDEEIMNAFIERDPEIESQIRKAYDNIHGMVTKRDYAIPWIKELKEKGYKVFYLSNFSYKSYTECNDALDFLPYTDGGILSYRDQVVKPEPAIYEIFLKRFGLVAQECVFLDDLQKNIDAAREHGMHGIQFKTKEQAEEELKKLGVN